MLAHTSSARVPLVKTHLPIEAERDCLEQDLVSVLSDRSLRFILWQGHRGGSGWPVLCCVDDFVHDLDGDAHFPL